MISRYKGRRPGLDELMRAGTPAVAGWMLSGLGL